MKLTAICILLACLNVSAEGLAQKVSLNENDATLEKVFRQIRKQTGYTFVYRDVLLKKAKRVTIHLSGATLEQALDACLQDQLLDYNIVNRIVVIREKMSFLKTDRITIAPVFGEISGKVTDDRGEPLAGATVTERGTNNSVVTKEDGSFSINTSRANATLVISYVGFATREVAVNNQTSISITLAQANASLNDVVVVGYGTQRRRDVTGAIGSVSSKDIKDQVVSRADLALVGKMAGVQVRQANGAPGAAPQIRIRGVNSISQSNDPLVVIDGFPGGSIASVNPADIESIDVLKDASASAIYGSRAANGVIIISTKRAKAGKSQVNFNAYRGVQQVEHKMQLMDAKQIAQYQYDAVRNQNLDEGNNITGAPTTWRRPVDQITLDVLEGRNTTNTDWQDEIFREAPIENYQLGISGKTGKIGYYVSGEYFNQEGIIINSGFKRYSTRINLDAEVSDRFKISFNLNPSFSKSDVSTTSGGSGDADGIVTNATQIQPFFPVYNDDGTYFNAIGKPGGANANNPVALANLVENESSQSRLFTNFTAAYQILKGLELRTLFGADLSSSRGKFFRPQTNVFNFGPAFGASSSSQNLNWLSEYTLSYSRSFSNVHNVQAIAGYTVQKNEFETNNLSSNKYPNNLISDLNAVGNQITGGSSSRAEWSLLSWLGRVNYNYNNRYFITASVRRDGSSRFGPQNRWATFPSLAASWRVSEESFLAPVTFISNLKLRASLGYSGNNNIPDYEFVSTVGFVNYPFGTLAQGSAPNKIANSGLKWEKLREYNFGVDLGLFRDRVSLTADYFNKNNRDLLLQLTVPGINGFNSSLQNIGSVTNRGLELSLNTDNLRGAFSWTTNLNFSFYRNEVDALGPKGDDILFSPGVYADFSHITSIGKPIGMFYGWVTDGVIKNAEELKTAPVFGKGTTAQTRVGDLRFVDQNGDGLVTTADRVAMGNPHPKYIYGMTNNFAFKNFDLSATLQGVVGHDILMANKFLSVNTRGRHNHPAYMYNYWKSESDPGNGNIPRPNNSPTGNNRGVFSTFHLEKGSFMRVNNLVLGYTLPSAILARVKMQALRVYVAAQNPFLITDYTGYNPDVSDSGDSRRLGVDVNNYPTLRTITAGINLGF